MANQNNHGNFFMRLNFNLRSQIYQYLDFPPFGPGTDVAGFILSCHQAYNEAAAASEQRLRDTLQDAHNRTLGDTKHPLLLPDSTKFRGFADIRSLTVKLPYAYPGRGLTFFKFLRALVDLQLDSLTVLFFKTDEFAGLDKVVAYTANSISNYMGTKHWKDKAKVVARVDLVILSWDLVNGGIGDDSVEVCYNWVDPFSYTIEPREMVAGYVYEVGLDEEAGRIVVTQDPGWARIGEEDLRGRLRWR